MELPTFAAGSEQPRSIVKTNVTLYEDAAWKHRLRETPERFLPYSAHGTSSLCVWLLAGERLRPAELFSTCILLLQEPRAPFGFHVQT
jgi:hypothetical protein